MTARGVWHRWAAIVCAMALVFVANQPVAVADDIELRAELATKPGLVDVLAVSGNDVLVALDGSYRLSHDGGKAWQTANLTAFCGGTCPGLHVGTPDGGVVPIWVIVDEDGGTKAATFTLATNTAGTPHPQVVANGSVTILAARGARLLLSVYDSNTGQSIRRVVDLSTGGQGPVLPADFDARALTHGGAVGFLNNGVLNGVAAGKLAVADASGATTVIDSAVATTSRRIGAVGTLVYYAFVDPDGEFRTCVRDLTMASSNCSPQPLWASDDWSSGYGWLTVTQAGVLVDTQGRDEHNDLLSGSWQPVVSGAFGPAVSIQQGHWRAAHVQDAGIPLLSTVDLAGSYLVRPAADGSLARQASMPWARYPVDLGSLTLTPTAVVGSDMRNWIMVDWEDESSDHQTSWRRSIGTSLGSEAVFSTGRGYPLASGVRLVEGFQDGDDTTQGAVVVHDGDATKTLRFQYFSGVALSGPYLLASWTKDDGDVDGTKVLMPSGQWRTTANGIDLFGSLLLERPDAGSYRVTDLTGSSSAIVFTLDEGDYASDQHIWGDRVGFSRQDETTNQTTAVIYNYRTKLTLSRPGNLLALGDGVAVIRDDEGPAKVWNLATDTTSADLGDQDWGPVALEGNRVAYTENSQLVVKRLTGFARSAPRSLGVVAPGAFTAYKGEVWSADIDLSKPVVAGQLRLVNAAGSVVRSLNVPATGSGAIRRVVWDGKNDAGTLVAPGDYTFNLTSTAVDGSGAVVTTSGIGRDLGKVRVDGPTVVPATPVVGGSAVVGGTLTVARGVWAPAGVTLSYQWLRDGQPIVAATSVTYVAGAADVDHGIAVRVTGFYGGATASATSSRVRVVKASFKAAPQPVVSGTWFYAKTVTATPGPWAPTPDALTYQWLRDGQPISGAVASTYTFGGGDVGHLVSVRVTGAKAGFTTVQSYSAARAVSGFTFSRTGSVAVGGTAKVGNTVKAKVGKSSPTPKTADYQWLRNGVAITGATAAKRTLVPADLGATISLRVTVSKDGYLSVTKTSRPTKRVSAGTLTTATPKISGKARVGQVLSAKPGTWRPVGVALAYQWYRNGKAIVGATGITYTPVLADKSRSLKVKVTGVLAGYSTASKTSKSTGKVK